MGSDIANLEGRETSGGQHADREGESPESDGEACRRQLRQPNLRDVPRPGQLEIHACLPSGSTCFPRTTWDAPAFNSTVANCLQPKLIKPIRKARKRQSHTPDPARKTDKFAMNPGRVIVSILGSGTKSVYMY
jgi:hypothetical protein